MLPVYPFLSGMLLACGTVIPPDGPVPDEVLAESVSAITRVHDLAFFYEGKIDYIQKVESEDGPVEIPDALFQASYVYDRSGRTHIDLNGRSNDGSGRSNDGSGSNRIIDLAGRSNDGSGSNRIIVYDGNDRFEAGWRDGRERPEARWIKGVDRNLREAFSPERFLYLWVLANIDDYAERHFEYVGWEELAGHRVLHVAVANDPKAPPPGLPDPILHLWIDVERGGHPLLIETYSDDELVTRTILKSLKRFSAPREPGSDETIEVWLPTQAEYTEYCIDPSVTYRGPLLKESYFVLDDSVLINQGVSNADFRLTREGDLPEDSRLRKIRRDASRRIAEEALIEASVPLQQRLEAQLAEAERQGRVLEASSPARETFSGTLITQIVLVLLGGGLIGSVMYARWRGMI